MRFGECPIKEMKQQFECNVSAAVGLVGTAISAYAANKRARSDREASAGQANKAAALAQYVPEKAAFEDANYDERKERLGGLYDKSQESGFRDTQTDLVSRLTGKLDGTAGPSLAQRTLQSGTEQAGNQALGLAQSQGGGGLGLLNALKVGSSGALNAGGKAAELGLREEAATLGQLGGVAQAGRAGDLGQSAQGLAIAQQFAGEDENNRQALINREKIIAAGRHAAAGVRSNLAVQNSKNAAQSGARESNLLSNFVSKGIAPAFQQISDGWGSNNSGPGLTGDNFSLGYDPNAYSGGYQSGGR